VLPWCWGGYLVVWCSGEYDVVCCWGGYVVVWWWGGYVVVVMFAPPRDPGGRPPNLLPLDCPPCTIPPRSLRLLSGQEGTQQHIRIMQGTTKPSKPIGMTMLEMRLFILSKSSMFEFHLLSCSLLSSSWPLFICSTRRSNSSCLLLTSLSKSAKGSRF